MKIKKIASLFILVNLLACVSKMSDAKEFNFSEFKISHNNKVFLEVKSNGNVIQGEKLVGKIKKEKDKGLLIGIEDGEIMLIISGDEVIKAKTSEHLCTVNKYGKGVNNKNRHYEWSREGKLVVNGKVNKLVQLEPVNYNSMKLATIFIMNYK